MQSDGEEEHSSYLSEYQATKQSEDNNKLDSEVDQDQAMLDDIVQNKTAYYNAASEKSLSHEEAKLFYHRHRLEQSQKDIETNRLSSRAKTFPSMIENQPGLVRTTYASPRKNTGENITRDQAWRPDSNLNMQSPRFKDIDTHEEKASIDSSMYHADVEDPTKHRDYLESNMRNITMQDSDISSELSAICCDIKRVLDIRHSYIQLSLQGPSDNPKDSPSWKIYPPPPNPSWDDNKNRPAGQMSGREPFNEVESSAEGLDVPTTSSSGLGSLPPVSPSGKQRKPGHDIGEDFEMEDLLPLPGVDEGMSFDLDPGSVYQIYHSSENEVNYTPVVKVPTLRDFYRDMDELQKISSDGPTKSFAYRQLDIIEGKFHLYFLVHSYQETADSKKAPHRDFYNVRKVDTHVHHSACMNQKHLLRFIKSKMKKSPHEIVMFRDGKELTLQEVFQSIKLTAYDLSIDTLDMHAHTDSFHRFDKFNLKYNPIGESRLREIFLKTDNYIKGRYLAEITKEVISDIESSKYQFVEWRVSIYGRSMDEWDKLAAWVIDNKLVSHNVRWLIQIPRLYSLYKANGQMENYEQILINIFHPLYEVTKDPSSHDKLHVFLQRVVGFDSVDDESKTEVRLYRKYPPPREWNTKQNPPYTYWIYHLFANLTSLNQWRKRRGFNTFVLRPHCGEAGDVDHIAAAVLCCHSISHGLMLRKVPLLQYIFYLDQIGIAMSPLSNNALFLAYDRNPFQKYFKRGLNVSLSTDDPLQFAFTKEPLIEEYAVAAQIYRLSAVDMCELAQHSVLQSGFEHELKTRWLGPNYNLPGVSGNNVAKSNVPNIREKFRYETLTQELEMLERYVAASAQSRVSTTWVQKRPTPSTTMQSLTNAASPALQPISNSDTDLKNIDRGRIIQSSNSPIPLLPTSVSPSQASPSYWTAPPPPRIFPGVVHQRARKGSMRQGSASEKDVEIDRSTESLPWVQGGQHSRDMALEEAEELRGSKAMP